MTPENWTGTRTGASVLLPHRVPVIRPEGPEVPAPGPLLLGALVSALCATPTCCFPPISGRSGRLVQIPALLDAHRHAQVSRVAHSTFCTHAAPITPVGHQAWSIAATWHLGLPRFWDGSAPTQSSRGLLRLHSRCGLRTRSTSFRGLLLRGFGSEGHPSSPPDGFRGASTIPRAGLPPAGDVHLSRRTQKRTKPNGRSRTRPDRCAPHFQRENEWGASGPERGQICP
jgi:hypothetical protein